MTAPAAFDEALLNVLICPADHAKLTYSEANQTLTCEKCTHVYPVENGIPNFLK